jgi:hypothetical protein
MKASKIGRPLTEILDDPKNGAEIGVFRGGTSRFLLSHFPDLHLYCIDAWAPVYRHRNQSYISRADQDQFDKWFKDFSEAVEEFGDRCTVLRHTSVKAATHVPDKSLDFIFFDADHCYESVKIDILTWLPKVKEDGILSGHDYSGSWPGVKKAVNELLGKPNTFRRSSVWYLNTSTLQNYSDLVG